MNAGIDYVLGGAHKHERKVTLKKGGSTTGGSPSRACPAAISSKHTPGALTSDNDLIARTHTHTHTHTHTLGTAQPVYIYTCSWLITPIAISEHSGHSEHSERNGFTLNTVSTVSSVSTVSTVSTVSAKG